MYSLSLQNCLIICFSCITENSEFVLGVLCLFGCRDFFFLWFLLCFALFCFQKQNQSKDPNRFTEPHNKYSRKTIEEKYPVKEKLQLSLALYLHNRCNLYILQFWYWKINFWLWSSATLHPSVLSLPRWVELSSFSALCPRNQQETRHFSQQEANCQCKEKWFFILPFSDRTFPWSCFAEAGN